MKVLFTVLAGLFALNGNGRCAAFVSHVISASVPANLPKWITSEGASALFASVAGDTSGSSKLTSQDIINRARKMSGLPVEEEEEEIKIFEDELLEKMQRCLLLLEKRVQHGPGSLAAEEVAELSDGFESIISEMRSFQNQSQETSNDSNVGSPYVSTDPISSPASSSVESNWGSSARRTATTTSEDTSNDEGPAYGGSGGLGLAKGTKNTYIIEGMDEMTPEEYQAALQKSVIDAQAERRKARRQVVGNKAAHDYLNTLGYGGTSGSLSGGKTSDD